MHFGRFSIASPKVQNADGKLFFSPTHFPQSNEHNEVSLIPNMPSIQLLLGGQHLAELEFLPVKMLNTASHTPSLPKRHVPASTQKSLIQSEFGSSHVPLMQGTGVPDTDATVGLDVGEGVGEGVGDGVGDGVGEGVGDEVDILLHVE